MSIERIQERLDLIGRMRSGGLDMSPSFSEQDILDLIAENQSLRTDAERYRWLRSRDLETIAQGGVFAGMTPQNMVLNEETLDEAVDAAIAQEARP